MAAMLPAARMTLCTCSLSLVNSIKFRGYDHAFVNNSTAYYSVVKIPDATWLLDAWIRDSFKWKVWLPIEPYYANRPSIMGHLLTLQNENEKTPDFQKNNNKRQCLETLEKSSTTRKWKSNIDKLLDVSDTPGPLTRSSEKYPEATLKIPQDQLLSPPPTAEKHVALHLHDDIQQLQPQTPSKSPLQKKGGKSLKTNPTLSSSLRPSSAANEIQQQELPVKTLSDLDDIDASDCIPWQFNDSSFKVVKIK